MNSLFGGSNLLKSILDLATCRPAISSSWTPVRFASKKSTGGNRNSKQGRGNNPGIKKQDGKYVYPGDVLLRRQQKLWFHPGLNVTIARKHMNLIAMKEGIVRVTCEKPDLNWSWTWAKQFYGGREGQTFYKKYFNVIPRPQHTRFKCIDQI